MPLKKIRPIRYTVAIDDHLFENINFSKFKLVHYIIGLLSTTIHMKRTKAIAIPPALMATNNVKDALMLYSFTNVFSFAFAKLV